MLEKPEHIIFFDGVCNLCNNAVQFIIKNDKGNVFCFATLQSEIARTVLAKSYPTDQKFETLLYYDNGKIYSHSLAALHIARKLDFPYYLLYSFRILPTFIRDGLYKIVSRNRYKWFGKKDHCMVPSPELKKKFLVSSL
jgi:predicted DCC family thiol-disulfide oxidoreductase YuxK